MPIVAVSSASSSANEKVVPFNSAKRDLSAATVAPEAEIDAVARLLCCVSTHSNLWGAMLSYRSDLPRDQAMIWAEQVIRRMDKIAPSPSHRKAYEYGKPWIEQSLESVAPQTSIGAKVVLPALILGGLGVFAMSMVGFVATYHHLLAR